MVTGLWKSTILSSLAGIWIRIKSCLWCGEKSVPTYSLRLSAVEKNSRWSKISPGEVFLSKVWMWLICSTIRPGLSRWKPSGWILMMNLWLLWLSLKDWEWSGWLSICARMKEGFFRLQSVWSMNFCLKENWFYIRREKLLPGWIIIPMARGNINNCLWRSWSTRRVLRPARFLPERYRTMTGEISSDAVLSVKGWCRNKGCCRIIRLYDWRWPVIMCLPAVPFKNLMTKEKKNIIPIFINACCMGNFLRKIVYILMKNLNTRRLVDVRYTVAAESCPICSYPEIRSVSPVIWWR